MIHKPPQIGNVTIRPYIMESLRKLDEPGATVESVAASEGIKPKSLHERRRRLEKAISRDRGVDIVFKRQSVRGRRRAKLFPDPPASVADSITTSVGVAVAIAKPEPVRCYHCGESIDPNHQCELCGVILKQECQVCHAEAIHDDIAPKEEIVTVLQ